MVARMRRPLTNAVLAAATFLVVFGVWISLGRGLSLLSGRIATAHLDALPPGPFTFSGSPNGGILRIGELPMSTDRPDFKPYPLQLRRDSDRRLTLMVSGNWFVLGPIRQESSVDGAICHFVPEEGDRVVFDLRQGLLSWPTPFDFNFMSGLSPSWKRHVYYSLGWKKRAGPELQMLWRYEQYFYPGNGWTSGFMTRQGETGLIRVAVQPLVSKSLPQRGK